MSRLSVKLGGRSSATSNRAKSRLVLESGAIQTGHKYAMATAQTSGWLQSWRASCLDPARWPLLWQFPVRRLNCYVQLNVWYTGGVRRPKNPYRARGGKAQPRSSVVAFLDILGFQELVRTAYKDGQSHQLLEKLRKALREAREHLEGEDALTASGDATWGVKVFTDNVVLGIPITGDGELDLGLAFSLIGLYQYKLVQHGFFIRGGIAVGELYMDEDVVFGEALLEAYDAESRLARDPRVVLAPSALGHVQRDMCYYASIQDTPHDNELLVDVDDQVFIDYLMVPLDGVAPDQSYFDDVLNHKLTIEANLRRFRSEPRYWNKYAWAANYHNLVCGHLQFDPTKYGIDPVDLQPHPRKLHAVYKKKPGRLILRRSGIEVARRHDLAGSEPVPDA